MLCNSSDFERKQVDSVGCSRSRRKYFQRYFTEGARRERCRDQGSAAHTTDVREYFGMFEGHNFHLLLRNHALQQDRIRHNVEI